MIEVFSWDGESRSERLDRLLERRGGVDPQVEDTVRQILRQVRQEGDVAVCRVTHQVQGVTLSPENFRVDPETMRQTWDGLDGALRGSIAAAADNIKSFHQKQRRNSWFDEDGDGVILGKKVTPLDRVGVYVPGGEAPLFSSLMMAAIPAQVAGVGQICVVSPPQENGMPHPTVLAAAAFLGIEECYGIGGAQAVGAMAYGTATVPRVDKIVGPGSPYTVAAMQQVFGEVGIASLPGPSEIVVVADAEANPAYIAADLLSQAEHGWGAAAVCLTPSAALAERVAAEVEALLQRLPRAEVMRDALEAHGAVVVVPDIEAALDLSNRMAPEHVELLVERPWDWLGRVRHAGAVFMGPASTEPVGDYFAGTNHILPIRGAARYASSLGLDDFVKTTSIISYTETRLRRSGPDIVRLAQAEGLEAHAEAVRVRLRNYGVET
jgi:histidinol dehydrogenase